MASFLSQKQILLGITGSIAAYKSADLVRRLREAGAIVRVAMTENAKRFITPLTMQAVSGFPIHDDLFDLHAEAAMGHIELARWADLVLVAPASADFIARLANGMADDLLTTLCLATKSPIAIAPAMNQGMWLHNLTDNNIQKLTEHGIQILGTAEGDQACGDVGPGRMLEPTNIVEKLDALFKTDTLSGLNVIVTAGPTHEAIDPVRYLTNGSSGKMGYALAEAARDANANVTLISGPVNIETKSNVLCIPVVTAVDMHAAVMERINDCDIFIAVAAVSDYRARDIATQKIHKQDQTMSLLLTRNPDIVAEVSARSSKPFIVGFAAETENVLENAKAKRLRKKMDMIVANQVTAGIGMGVNESEVTVISAQEEIRLSFKSKVKLAKEIIELIGKEYKNHHDRKHTSI